VDGAHPINYVPWWGGTTARGATFPWKAEKSVGVGSRQKWVVTEIAERHRSVLVMRTRYSSAGLTPHQCGGLMLASQLQLCNKLL